MLTLCIIRNYLFLFSMFNKIHGPFYFIWENLAIEFFKGYENIVFNIF